MSTIKNLLVGALVTFACFSTQSLLAQKPKELMDNPLLQVSSLQYQAPPFDRIKDEHFKPAFIYALKIHDAEIDKIANDKSTPTFQNTVLALETSGADLNRATIIFGNLTGSNTNPTLQKIDEEFAPIFAAHNDKLYLNSKIYKRIKALNLVALKG